MNKLYLIGRLTKDPELRKTPTDISVVNFTIAVNRDYTPKGEEKQADFIPCIAWRTQAENLCKYIRKGGLIAIDGSLQTGSYDDENGVKHFKMDVIANHIEFLESKKQEQNTTEKVNSNYQKQKEEFNNQFENLETKNDISADDLPF